jgi:hypothetical protein
VLVVATICSVFVVKCIYLSYSDTYSKLGRRRKSGYQEGGGVLATANIRNKSLKNLLTLHNAVALNWNGRHKTKLFNELYERHKKDCPYCFSSRYQDPSYLICHWLNSDDVMRVLKCNRRTALDYLQVLRDIVGPYVRSI